MSRIAAAFVVLAFGPAVAMASQQGAVALQNWRGMDKCAKDAQVAFPDHTADANAKRDAKLKECLQQKNMPPRQSLSPGQ
jgi:hypothetical protein